MEKVNYSDGEFQDRDRKLKNKSTRNAENETSEVSESFPQQKRGKLD